MKKLEKTTRNLGIDLLRIVAMFMIVYGHVIRFSFSSFSATLSHDSSQYIWLTCLNYFCLVGVNIYAMISGYVMVNKEPSISKLIPMWLQLVFISLAIAGFARLFHCDITNKPLWKYALPISQKCWWYMTAYFGMYPFLPFINHALRKMTKRELLTGGGFLIVFFSLIPTCSRNRNLFELEHGYSVVWLLVCYILGAIIFLLQNDVCLLFD